jgi:enoyl-CoA hydratase/carnithine racemase
MSLVTTEISGKVGWLVLNRPEKLNAFNAALLAEFEAAVDALGGDDRVAVIVIRGEGRAFSVGYDVAGGGAPTDRVRALDDWLNLRGKIETWLKVWRCPKPVIAAVHGFCMGGATMLAVCCDLTVVARNAVIGWPSVPLGGGLLSPVSAWLIGPKKAKEMSYVVGSRMSGQEAADWGWANYAVAADEVNDRAGRLAGQIAKTPVELLQVKKRALNRVMDMQGFSEAVMFGAEFDAIAHDSNSVESTTEEIKELGLKQTIARFTAEGEA